MKNKLDTIATSLLLIGFLGCTGSLDKDLIAAANTSDAKQIRVLLQRRANPNALAADGWTALTMAAREGISKQ